MMNDVMTMLQEEAIDNSVIRTENGALGLQTTGEAFVDFFYNISSMRGWDVARKRKAFRPCFLADRELAARLLFFVRDIRGGAGERSLFRELLTYLPADILCRLIPLVPEYGRWDDLLYVLENCQDKKVVETVFDLIRKQWNSDQGNAEAGKPISLLAKWLPSPRKVKEDSVKLAKKLYRTCLGMTEEAYRKGLSKLRKHLRVVERDMTLGRWGEIDYATVPSKAGLIYSTAFLKHDGERRKAFLEQLEKGEATVKAGALYPHEVVSKYRQSMGVDYNRKLGGSDPALEAAWKALPLPDGMLHNAIVVRDGSGSMTTGVSGRTTALDVATALAVFLAENLSGPFKNRFITFSRRPRFVDLSKLTTLHDKLVEVFGEDECENTNIEATLKLLLDVAVKNRLRQEEIPTVVIISDMEFDAAASPSIFHHLLEREEKVLFEQVRESWHLSGYELPKLVFWNVNSRTSAIPLRKNDNGLLLVSGFSQSILDMLSKNGNMFDVLKEKLMTPRYDPVAAALRQ